MEKHSPQMHLQTLLQDFHSITHISISYLPVQSAEDMTGAMRFDSHAEMMNRFVSQLYRIPQIKEHMDQMEADAISRVSKYHESVCRFDPFPGLTVYVFPVVSHSIILGCFSFGPVRLSQSRLSHAQRAALYQTHGLDPSTMTELYEQLPICDDPAMMAASRLLSQIVVYASSIDSITIRSRPLSVRIAEYIDTQYMNAISTSTACEHFHISRSTLGRTLSKDFGNTFLSMLSHRRIRNVCKCLEEGLSPEEASTLSGFSSPLYMARVFRTIMGCTPHAYCKMKNESRSTQQEETNAEF